VISLITSLIIISLVVFVAMRMRVGRSQKICKVEEKGYTCTLKQGHGGNRHIAHGINSEVYRWKVWEGGC